MTSNKTKSSLLMSDKKAEEALKALLNKGVPLYLSYGLTEKHLDVLFLTAYNLYSEKKYKESLSVFSRINLWNHFDKRGWIGSGACCQILHLYDTAISCYSHASSIDMEDPLPIFRTIECYVALKKYSDALSALEVIKPLVKDKPEFVHVKNDLTKIEKLLLKSK